MQQSAYSTIITVDRKYTISWKVVNFERNGVKFTRMVPNSLQKSSVGRVAGATRVLSSPGLNTAGFALRMAGRALIVLFVGDIVNFFQELGNNPPPGKLFPPDKIEKALWIQIGWKLGIRNPIKIVRSTDPNLKLTNGIGGEGFINLAEPLEYTILFENKANASAPAQKVVIEDNLDWQLDTSTLELVAYGFNRQNRRVLPGQAQVEAYVSVDTDPNPVHVHGGLETGGKLRWVLESLDPNTLQPPEDPLAGFLPPNDALQRGEGFVTFRIRPKSGLADGTQIFNQAEITFDVNTVINTPVVTNTLDLGVPTATVNPLPAESHSPFAVSWSGSDGEHGSGVATFDLYVSEDGGAYRLWLAGMQTTSATFDGVVGRKYDFFAVATDAVGNRTPAAFTAQASTQVTQGTWQLHLPLVSRKPAATRH